jgi:hypothetical protein
LSVLNEGDETYPLRSWPIIAKEDVDAYQVWFDKEWVSGKPLYVTRLPALHRILFVLINNILTPKSNVKTNMEQNIIFYLRHLIPLDDIKLNIPYIILWHMKTIFSSKFYSLSYSTFIHRITLHHCIKPILENF